MDYEELFSRNLGTLDSEQQDRLRSSRVFVIGCGGIGGIVAAILARSGIQKFILADPDSFDTSNMNRQIGCFHDTLGRNKAEVIGSEIRRINPAAEIETYPRVIPLEELDALIERCDLIFPAMDDLGYGVASFRKARAAKKPALLAMPVGLWAVVSIILPDGTTVESLNGIPPIEDTAVLSQLLTGKRVKAGIQFYSSLGGWQEEYLDRFAAGEAPYSQICAAVWLSSSLGALEAVKFLSGKEECVAAPEYWLITRRGISKQSTWSLNRFNFTVWKRKLAWKRAARQAGGSGR